MNLGPLRGPFNRCLTPFCFDELGVNVTINKNCNEVC